MPWIGSSLGLLWCMACFWSPVSRPRCISLLCQSSTTSHARWRKSQVIHHLPIHNHFPRTNHQRFSLLLLLRRACSPRPWSNHSLFLINSFPRIIAWRKPTSRSPADSKAVSKKITLSLATSATCVCRWWIPSNPWEKSRLNIRSPRVSSGWWILQF